MRWLDRLLCRLGWHTWQSWTDHESLEREATCRRCDAFWEDIGW